MAVIISHRIAIAVVILLSACRFESSGCYWPDVGGPDCYNRRWSSWSSCDYPCGTNGTQTRYKIKEECYEDCNELQESRRCSGTLPVDCKLSSWSEWNNSCSLTADRCAFSRNQTSTRYKSRTEGCGGTCRDAEYEKSRQCKCFNGGTPSPNGTCQCKEGLYGACCEDHTVEKSSWQKRWLGFLSFLALFGFFYIYLKEKGSVGPQ